MKRVIVSGYFNPLHGGHLDMFEEARKLGDSLLVIVNNDEQALQKKGRIILDETNRVRLVKALSVVDEVTVSADKDRTVCQTLANVRKAYPNDELIFANGGDRDGERAIPETQVCKSLNIEMVFGVGSQKVVKRDSSTRIISEMEAADNITSQETRNDDLVIGKDHEYDVRKDQKKSSFEPKKCPNCKKKSYIVSIFGSICSNCFYEPKR